MNEKAPVLCDNCGTPLKVYIADHGNHYCDQSCRAFHEAVGCPTRTQKEVQTEFIFQAWPDMDREEG